MAAQERYKGRGIAGVWRYEIESVKEETASTRIGEEEARRILSIWINPSKGIANEPRAG
ncbi:MAG: hypothetical protein LBT81_00290 [Helicobacteraceae bacterium]|nr:hypothetical protein [Helicobacteraceae bacterium]